MLIYECLNLITNTLFLYETPVFKLDGITTKNKILYRFYSAEKIADAS